MEDDELFEGFEIVGDLDEDEEVVVEESGLSAKEVAKLFGVTARELRKFLRRKNGKIGQGNRWSIDEDDVDDLRDEFMAFKQGDVELPVYRAEKRDKSKRGPKRMKEERQALEDAIRANEGIVDGFEDGVFSEVDE